MKKFIYRSRFQASPEVTELQLSHFYTDVKFAFANDYSYIKSKDGLTFQIMDEDNIVEVDVTEEELQTVWENMHELLSEPEVTELPEDDDDYDVQLHNIMLIDKIINNTLLQEGKLPSESFDNMLKLAELKHKLMEEYCE